MTYAARRKIKGLGKGLAFSDSQLAEVTKDFRDKPISFAELLEAEALVNKKYTDAGYINSGAVIPEKQDLSF
ncbi:hypothetical protein LC593_13395 [Nostoc sp. CHAB 5844]|nr:hypothetical protein [Nostoc sp. CHAB 5844]